ncbi:DoxX family protein [Pedobacter sp. ISL-68]|uniref:MauE/DoxX family redox-associated membrane protein n=1 Tax=unclassified Pedobacter TaxID=2628915 RepID=UPI001BE9C25A|nr:MULTISPECIES: MauE/DoxX family redox-associated membrane protein [unclassified Pedobacter]MBT2559832.1 DoxX family protein [Pedobacter sp. ISL-64]MBT2592137.1 DoxX family protein [Pedobacter sp. ISL-68]
MRKLVSIAPIIAAYFFALLFIYASLNKVLDFENFQIQLAQSPLLSAYAGFISYVVIICELIIAGVLCIKNGRLIGLYLSLGIMVSFTVYIYLILNYSDFVPCSCGGILEKLGWTEHLIFNIVCILIAFAGIYILQQQNKRELYKTIVTSITISVVSAGVIICLFLSSENIIKRENNFTRRFLLHPVIKDKTLDLKLNSYYFAGIDSSKIYLGNVTAPLILTLIDTALNGTSQMKIHLDKSDYKFRNLQIQIKAPFYYLFDGSVPIIYRGKFGDSVARTISYKDAYFNQLVVIDSSKFAIRTQNSNNRQYTLAKLDLKANLKVQIFPSILEKQVDGVFDSDGKLIKSSYTTDLVYTYSYRNEFIVIDSGLNIKKRLRTIDTTKMAKIVSRRLTDGRHKMSAPPLTVNKNQTLNGKLLFNQSNLMGKYESSKTWKKASVIDMYRIDRQEYIGSFYIYNQKENTMSNMMGTDKYLFVIIRNELIRYHYRIPL